MFVGVIAPTTELIVAYNLELLHMQPPEYMDGSKSDYSYLSNMCPRVSYDLYSCEH